MADIKWIKIVTDIFDDEKVLLLESLPESDGVIVIWFKLLCMAGKQNNSGVFMMNNKIPYTAEMLSTIFRRNINLVRISLKAFEEFGMIEIVDNVVSIKNWDKHQNVDGMEKIKEQTRKRVERHREKQKLLANIETCQYCGEDATGVDHLIATARGGSDTDENKVPCCIRCNRIKNDKPIVDFLNGNRDIVNDGLIAKNIKISKHVTLCNVTDRYLVTQSNETDKNRLEEEKRRNSKKINNTKDIVEILDYMNLVCKKKFKPTTKTTIQHIENRIKEGYTVDEFKKVIEIKSAEWLDDAGMNVYLRPETLFGNKFESYLNSKPKGENNGNGNNNGSYEKVEHTAAELIAINYKWGDEAEIEVDF